MSEKSQPWKAAWPPADCQQAGQNQSTATPIEYGVAQGAIVVVDGTAANVKPAAPLRIHQTEKVQPWKASWPGRHADAASNDSTQAVDYGVIAGETVVVDGTAANVKPSARVQEV